MEVPKRSKSDEMAYKRNLCLYHKEVLDATIILEHLDFNSPSIITPQVEASRNYQNLERIGSGSGSVVYKSVDTSTGDVYVLKEFKRGLKPQKVEQSVELLQYHSHVSLNSSLWFSY